MLFSATSFENVIFTNANFVYPNRRRLASEFEYFGDLMNEQVNLKINFNAGDMEISHVRVV